MAADLYTKVALGVVAVCLVLLMAQGFGLGSRSGGTAPCAAVGGPGQAELEGRYKLVPVPMGRMAFRIDTQTGETWRADFRGGGTWTRIGEPGEEAAAPERGERPPARQGQGAQAPEQESAPAPQQTPPHSAE